jgi:mannosyltransferase
MAVSTQEKPGLALPSKVRRGRGRDRMAIVAPAALAAVLSLYRITGRSLGFDEGATVAIVSQHGHALWMAIAHDGGNMAGYYLLLHVLVGLFGDGLLVLRLPSALATVATVALVATIGIRLFDRRAGLIAGLLAAVSLPLIYWAQTARGYAPMVAFVCAGFLAFVALTDRREAPVPGRWPWIAYVVAMTLAMYCSVVAALVVPAQLLVLVHRRGARRRVGSAVAAIVVCSLPLAILAVRRGSGQLFWVPRPTRMVETQVLQSVTSAGLAPSFHHVATTYLLMWITMAAVLALVVDVIRRRRRGEAVWGMALTLAWCLVPAALTFLYSLVAQPVFVPRNVLTSTPAVGLALAASARDRHWPRTAAPVVLVGLLAVLALRALPTAKSYGVSPEPWQAVTAQVLAHSRPGDCIAFYPADGRMAFQYYLGTQGAATARAPRSILPAIRWGVVKSYVEDYVAPRRSALARQAQGCRRMWFIASHEGQPNGPSRARAHRAEYFRLDAELETLFGAGLVVDDGYASVIHLQLLPGKGR